LSCVGRSEQGLTVTDIKFS